MTDLPANALRSLQESAEKEWALFLRGPVGLDVLLDCPNPDTMKRVFLFAVMSAHVKALSTYLTAETVAYLSPVQCNWKSSVHPPVVAEGEETESVPRLLLKYKQGDALIVEPGRWEIEPPADLLGESEGRGFWVTSCGHRMASDRVVQWCYLDETK